MKNKNISHLKSFTN